MSKRAKIELNHRGIEELLRSSEIEGEVRKVAGEIAGRAGSGHDVEVSQGKSRVRATVITRSKKAMVAEAKDRNLLRAVDPSLKVYTTKSGKTRLASQAQIDNWGRGG